jgi:hypothetical protein
MMMASKPTCMVLLSIKLIVYKPSSSAAHKASSSSATPWITRMALERRISWMV